MTHTGAGGRVLGFSSKIDYVFVVVVVAAFLKEYSSYQFYMLRMSDLQMNQGKFPHSQ